MHKFNLDNCVGNIIQFVFKSEIYICIQHYSHSQIKCKSQLPLTEGGTNYSLAGSYFIAQEPFHFTLVMQVCNREQSLSLIYIYPC